MSSTITNNQEPWTGVPVLVHNNYYIITKNVGNPVNFILIWIINKNTYQTYTFEVGDTTPVPMDRFAQLFYNCVTEASNDYSFTIDENDENNNSLKIVIEIKSDFIPYRKEIFCVQDNNSQQINISTITNFARYHDHQIHQVTSTISQFTDTINQLENRVAYLENIIIQQNNTINNFINRFSNQLQNNNPDVNISEEFPVNNVTNNPNEGSMQDDNPSYNNSQSNPNRIRIRIRNGFGLGLGVGMIPMLPIIPVVPMTLGLGCVDGVCPSHTNNQY